MLRTVALTSTVLVVAVLAACGGADSAADNKAVVSRFVQEFKNNANHGIVDELFTADFVDHLKDPRLPPGRDGIKAVGQAVVGGLPDVSVTVEDLLADGDRVIDGPPPGQNTPGSSTASRRPTIR